jgi:hypothetical protein
VTGLNQALSSTMEGWMLEAAPDKGVAKRLVRRRRKGSRVLVQAARISVGRWSAARGVPPDFCPPSFSVSGFAALTSK